MPDTSPTPNLIQRLFGLVSPQAQQWPQLNQAVANQGSIQPDLMNKVTRIMQMGPLFKMMNPDAYAVTGPIGTVALNKDLINKDNQNVEDVLAHEMVHVGQGSGGFLRKFYQPSAVENEAVDKEAMRKVIRGDINLNPQINPNGGR
jgi:hypothetical protein